MIRQLRAHPFAADTALAFGLLALVVIEIWTGSVAPAARPANLMAAPLMTLPLALRRRQPVIVALVVVAAVKLQALAGGSAANTVAPILPLSVAMYTLAARADRRWLVAGAAGVALLIVVAAGRLDDALFAGILLAVPFALGLAVRSREQRADRVEAEAAVAVTDERQRIARELHDLVAHSVGVMIIQAAAGRRGMDRSPERAREALEAIEGTGRQALAEMQRMVGILREPEAGPHLEPQPGLRHLDTLIEQVRTAGLAVTLELDPAAIDVGPGIDLAAYRIVQEALTNTMRHSDARRARVAVRRCGSRLEVAVEDPGPSREGTTRSGHGLVGMRERAHLYGGRVESGRTANGGYAVRAWMPITT